MKYKSKIIFKIYCLILVSIIQGQTAFGQIDSTKKIIKSDIEESTTDNLINNKVFKIEQF